MDDIKYANAFSEVLEIIFHLSKEERDKIPEKFIKELENYSNKEYEFDYDPSKTLDEQGVLDETKTIIALICRDYFTSKEERQKIIEKEQKELEKIEIEQNKKYSYDKLFKKKNDVYEEPKELIIIPEKNVWRKIIDKIKNLFNKKQY